VPKNVAVAMMGRSTVLDQTDAREYSGIGCSGEKAAKERLLAQNGARHHTECLLNDDDGDQEVDGKIRAATYMTGWRLTKKGNRSLLLPVPERLDALGGRKCA